MRINLVIEADTPEELREACRAIGGGDPRALIKTRELAEEATSSVLVTGEPDDPYGDGNGPVDAAPQPEPVASDASNDPAYDSAGLPWDERIHAGSRALNKDGTWRRRKGVDDATVAAVEAELRNGDEPVHEPAAEPAEQVETTDAQPEPNVTPEPAAEPQPDATPEPAPATERTYTAQDVMKIIGSAMSSGSREPTYIAELCQDAQIGQIVDIFSNADALAAIVAKLRKDGVISDV